MKRLLLILLCFPIIGFGQCISGDCENGYGTSSYGNGDKYTGEWKNNMMNGRGTYTFGEGAWKGDIYLSLIHI